MLYSQPLATRFGTDLIAHIESGKWTHFDIAVAWVRASGIAHLAPSLIKFLQDGNQLNVIVGIDLDNTTKEGLEALLRLQSYGTVSLHIHHNEAGTIFHPKLYLFRNHINAALIVGSNNVTEAGLFRNTEAGLEITANIGDDVILSALNALGAWSDTSLGLAKALNSAFLGELVTNGYVKDEATVRAETAARKAAAKPKSGVTKKLFGTLSISAPAHKSSATSAPVTTASSGTAKKKAVNLQSNTKLSHTSPAGQVLLMRVRKARGTQIQIPLAVMATPFFTGASQVLSVASSVTRGIHATHAARAGAGANPNTLKLEMPETSSMADPVARFERNSSGVQYEVYDSSSPQGKAIMKALQIGRTTSPPLTFLTVPNSPASSTWWRFI